ncbi:hypothetical protein MLD38_027163 [Melastoma candidum]|uniref:Uncharacterized protein n=1 Tax=Melastoma candidum TaxID=119954 RepID=A0ACB9P2H3_9MYRT|nr:hypothetical protein MLD38_027163 [Melastoma candidum]
MVDADTAKTIVGIVGNVISFFLFLSPLPTIITIFKKKSVEGFKPDPYVATVLNCMMWILYGLPSVHPDSLLIITINGVGLAIEAIYVTVFIIYSPWPKRRKIIMAIIVELIFMAIMVFITLWELHTTKARSALVGILCVVFNIMMYASPLTVMKRVITTKSVKYMPFPLSLANFCNGCIWATYALLKFDPFVLIPNGLGAISGLVQLILYATFYGSTNWDEKPSEVELNGET